MCMAHRSQVLTQKSPGVRSTWALRTKGGEPIMQTEKGFYTSYEYRGWVESEKDYLPFASDSDYREWLEAHTEDDP